MDMNVLRAYCTYDVNKVALKELQEYAKQRNEKYLMRVLNRKYWPYHVKVEDDTGSKERWCYENFKSSEWRNVGTYFAFKRGEDATLFTLKWS